MNESKFNISMPDIVWHIDDGKMPFIEGKKVLNAKHISKIEAELGIIENRKE